jgi:hypothetical protein
MRHQRPLTVVAIVFSCLSAGAAQATAQVEFRKVGNKTITCQRMPPSSNLNECGFRPDWFWDRDDYVFVGSISSVNPYGKQEKKLQISLEEVFQGQPSNPLTVVTSQSACQPSLSVGDRWLFFLRKEKGKPVVLDYYSNHSRPVKDVQGQIETLRQLMKIGDFGLVRGSVVQGPNVVERKPIVGAHVVASRADKAQFFAFTDAEGHFEFQPLPFGSYELSLDSIDRSYFGKTGIAVGRNTCWDVTLRKAPFQLE